MAKFCLKKPSAVDRYILCYIEWCKVFIEFELLKNNFSKYYVLFSSGRWSCRSCYSKSLFVAFQTTWVLCEIGLAASKRRVQNVKWGCRSDSQGSASRLIEKHVGKKKQNSKEQVNLSILSKWLRSARRQMNKRINKCFTLVCSRQEITDLKPNVWDKTTRNSGKILCCLVCIFNIFSSQKPLN